MRRPASDPSFIDILITDHAGRNDQLDRIDQMIDWPKVAKKVNGIYASPEGRPAYPLVTMVKIIVLQQWYHASDAAIEEAVSDRLSFRRFAGLTLQDAVPDHSTISRLLAAPSEQTEEAVPEDADPPDEDAFWEQVATNLRAKNLRLLFVADAIPIELARVVEFLNAQFRDNIEVLAVEVKQFKGSSEERSTLVPNVIGHTAAPVSKGGAGGARIRSKISLDEFMSLLPSDAVRDATQQLLDVAQDRGAKNRTWRQGHHHQSESA